jgi:hypothetical protein
MTIMSVVLFGAVTTAQAQHEDALNVQMFLIRGPVRTVPESPAYTSWAPTEVSKLYNNMTLEDEDVGYRLLADYISEPLELTNQVLWTAVRITSKNPGTMFSLRQFSLGNLWFVENSSDRTDLLTNSYSPGNLTNLVYTQEAIGVIWGPGGQRVSDSVLNNLEPGDRLVNEIDFVGMQTKYFYPYAYPYQAVADYINGYTNYDGFNITFACRVIDGTNVLALGQRTIQTTGEPLAPIMSIVNRGDSVVVSVSNLQQGRTAVIQSTPRVGPANWQMEATVNANDELVRTKDPAKYFYRAYLE